jgi:hypothetical protein
MCDCVVGVDTIDDVSGTPPSKTQDIYYNTYLVTSTPNENGDIATNHR